MATLTPQQKRELKEELHALKPVVIIGNNGLTDNVLQEIDRALEDHELIKIRFNIAERAQHEEMTERICKSLRATLIQAIGNIIAIYRKSQKS